MPQTNVVDRRYVYRGKVVTLRIDSIETEDGRIIEREVVEHTGAVAIVPFLDSATVLLIRQYRAAVDEVLLEVPAGTCERGEDADGTASRELEEETGYRAGRMQRMFSQYLAPGYSSEVLHAYIAEDLTQVGAHTDLDEHIEVIPTPVSNIESMILNGQIKDAKSIASLLIAMRFADY